MVDKTPWSHQPRWPKATPTPPTGPGAGRWKDDGKPNKPHLSWAEVVARHLIPGVRRRQDARHDAAHLDRARAEDHAKQAEIRQRHGLPDDADHHETGEAIRYRSTRGRVGNPGRSDLVRGEVRDYHRQQLADRNIPTDKWSDEELDRHLAGSQETYTGDRSFDVHVAEGVPRRAGTRRRGTRPDYSDGVDRGEDRIPGDLVDRGCDRTVRSAADDGPELTPERIRREAEEGRARRAAARADDGPELTPERIRREAEEARARRAAAGLTQIRDGRQTPEPLSRSDALSALKARDAADGMDTGSGYDSPDELDLGYAGPDEDPLAYAAKHGFDGLRRLLVEGGMPEADADRLVETTHAQALEHLGRGGDWASRASRRIRRV